MQEHLFEESKCEILSLHDGTIVPTHVAYQNTGFLCFLNSLFIFSIVWQFLLLVLLDNQPTCVAPSFCCFCIKLREVSKDFWANKKPPFLIVSSARELQSSISAVKKTFFLLLLNFEFLGLIKESVTRVPPIYPNCQSITKKQNLF